MVIIHTCTCITKGYKYDIYVLLDQKNFADTSEESILLVT